MLVLSRSTEQQIVFPTLGISLKILQISDHQVRVGIDALAEIPVHRSEVADRIYREGLCHEYPK